MTYEASARGPEMGCYMIQGIARGAQIWVVLGIDSLKLENFTMSKLNVAAASSSKLRDALMFDLTFVVKPSILMPLIDSRRYLVPEMRMPVLIFQACLFGPKSVAKYLLPILHAREGINQKS